MTGDRCEYPGCRKPAFLTFLRHRFCEEHWDRDMKDINLTEVVDAIHTKTGRVPRMQRERPGDTKAPKAQGSPGPSPSVSVLPPV